MVKGRAFIAVVLVCLLVWASMAACCASEYAPGQILVKFKPGTPASAIADAHRNNGAQVLDVIPQIGVQKLSAPRGREMAQIRRYQVNPDVQFAELDYLAYPMEVIPNDPWWRNLWGLHYIQASSAWTISRGCKSIVIAVVDSGIDYTHPDLAGRVLPGYDFYDDNDDAMDAQCHGTHVAGIIGANTNNGIGVAGVTWYNPLLPVKVYGAVGATTFSMVAKGVTYATDMGARVVNMSLGASSGSSTIKNAVDYAYNRGVVLAAAAGNSGTESICYPAAYPNVIAVGASDDWDKLSVVSNYGKELDVIAPDGGISTSWDGTYRSMGGTSMSTAYVSGLCGLILSVNPALTPAQVMQIVRESADDIPPAGWDKYTGYGRINAYTALVMASGTGGTQPVDSVPPDVDVVNPADGAVLSGTVTLSAEASDDTGVAKVEFLVDGQTVGSSDRAPYTAKWDTSKFSNGLRLVSARAVDMAGNTGESLPVSVTVENPATVLHTFTGSLGGKVLTSYHTLSLPSPSAVSASLDWNKDDLDLYLLDGKGQVIASSATTKRPETISTGLLPAGNYQFKVVCVSVRGRAQYTLTVECSPQ